MGPRLGYMHLLDVMQTYFRGERMLAWALLGIGVGLLAFTFFLYRTQSGGFMWGLVVPLGLLGLGASIGGPIFAMQQTAKIEDLVQRHEEDPNGLVAAETERMAKVNAGWPRLKIAWTALAISALVLLMVVRREWASGLGLALIFIATTGFFVDVFAERRAEPYTAALTADDG